MKCKCMKNNVVQCYRPLLFVLISATCYSVQLQEMNSSLRIQLGQLESELSQMDHTHQDHSGKLKAEM